MPRTGSASIDIGRALSGGWWLIGRDVPRLLPLILTWWGLSFGISLLAFEWSAVAGLVDLLLSFAIDTFFLGTFYVLALSDASAPTRHAFQQVSARFLGLLALYAVTSFGIVAGFVLFIVPGIALAVLWTVSLPVFLVERKTVFQAMTASFNYVRPCFWPVFVLFAIHSVMVAAELFGLWYTGWLDYEAATTFSLGVESGAAVIVSLLGIYMSVATYREITFSNQHDVGVFD
ncbi:MAG: hypothetical protein HRT81_07875 [Henriciella sp.]|nr:hypothetical protein [Henriciella sp.]